MSDDLEVCYGFVRYKNGNYLRMSRISDIHLESVFTDKWILLASISEGEEYCLKEDLTRERAEKLREDLVLLISVWEDSRR